MKGARIGVDCNICGHVFVEAGARIGDRVIVKNGVSVWDKVTLEDEVFVGPMAAFTNDPVPRVSFKRGPAEFLPTRVRRGASIGANATILCGLTIGPRAFVGAGSVVLRDVPAHAVVAGNPARRVGWMCACGGRLPASLGCRCGRRYRRVSESAGLAAAGPRAQRSRGRKA
jgi:acetyltransferase-like isoleucine patch superfamily enzyme